MKIWNTKTDLTQLKALADWLGDDNELPSSGDAVCVLDAIEEIQQMRSDLKETIDAIAAMSRLMLKAHDDHCACEQKYAELVGIINRGAPDVEAE